MQDTEETDLRTEVFRLRATEQALRFQDPSGFVLDLQVYYLLATVYSRLGEHELARQYAELSKTAAVPVQDRARD